jgi:hypothetical protein
MDKRKISFGQFFIGFVPASYFAVLLYRDFFTMTQPKLLFFVWGFPCIHFVYAFLQLFSTVVGRKYRSYVEFSILKSLPIRKHFFERIKFSRLFIAIKVNGRERVLSGLFWYYPTSILVYKNIFDKLKVFTIGNVLIKVMWMFANLIVLAIMRFFLL